MESDQIYSRIENHVRDFFAGHEVVELMWTSGPIQTRLPRFRVLRVAPGPKSKLWVYVSLGAWEVDRDDASLEFMIFAPEANSRHVELLAMNAYYHSNDHLGLGHTLPIGEPWLEGSTCDHLLVSLPYPFGPDLEICEIDRQHIHLYWLLPITLAERNFKAQNGQDALEELFEECRLEYWCIDRQSVV